MKNQKTTSKDQISRKDALKKIGNYGKYAALTAVSTYMLLNPKKAQAFSGPGADPGDDFGYELDNDLDELDDEYND